MLEIIGDALIVAFGAVLIFIFWTIEVQGLYGAENNLYIRWVELFMGIPMIALGINRAIHDMRSRR